MPLKSWYTPNIAIEIFIYAGITGVASGVL